MPWDITDENTFRAGVCSMLPDLEPCLDSVQRGEKGCKEEEESEGPPCRVEVDRVIKSEACRCEAEKAVTIILRSGAGWGNSKEEYVCNAGAFRGDVSTNQSSSDHTRAVSLYPRPCPHPCSHLCPLRCLHICLHTSLRRRRSSPLLYTRIARMTQGL